MIYRPEVIPRLNQMLEFWSDSAKAHGLQGLIFAYQQQVQNWAGNDDSMFQYDIEFQPGLATTRDVVRTGVKATRLFDKLRTMRQHVYVSFERRHGIDLGQKVNNAMMGKRQLPLMLDYDDVWSTILKTAPSSEKSIAGAFVGWDNTPRKKERGEVIWGATPEKFRVYMVELIRKARAQYENDYIFINAWNEWAEGAYLEPTESDGFSYLEALREALLETGEYEIC